MNRQAKKFIQSFLPALVHPHVTKNLGLLCSVLQAALHLSPDPLLDIRNRCLLQIKIRTVVEMFFVLWTGFELLSETPEKVS